MRYQTGSRRNPSSFKKRAWNYLKKVVAWGIMQHGVKIPAWVHVISSKLSAQAET